MYSHSKSWTMHFELLSSGLKTSWNRSLSTYKGVF
jgi:hypothetical protein